MTAVMFVCTLHHSEKLGVKWQANNGKCGCLQILALFAMECPVSLDAEDIRNEKVKLLRNIKPIALDDIVVGQYRGVTMPGQGYLPGMPSPVPTLGPFSASTCASA